MLRPHQPSVAEPQQTSRPNGLSKFIGCHQMTGKSFDPRIRPALVCLVLSLAAGCSANPRSMPADQLQNTGKPALHAIMDERLRTLMAQMNALMFEQIRTEVELDHERRLKSGKIAEAARQLQHSIEQIQQVRPGLNLGHDDEAAFAGLATKLKSEAQQIESLAASGKLNELKPLLAETEQSCMACHSLFRRF